MNTKEAFQHTVVDERPRKEVTTERQSEVFDLVYRKGHSRREMAHDAEDRILGDLPDTEEA